MTWWVILIEMLVFAGIFTTVLFLYYRGERKYSPESIHNYPPQKVSDPPNAIAA